ncbi:MFS transporter [Halobacteria archaeon AArc-m2/3/4]|uniref:MFS transporter n=1 Tax=Natronoglomus mannanivorans TaxID=2979990 RepID=A0ABT2QD42_9EURY|nr:MFS transporter [Halobacteria archaeon AArc-m2/3/4]
MSEQGEVTLRAYGLVLAATVSYTSLTFIWFTLPAYLSVVIEEVGLTGTEAGILAGAVPLTYIPLALFTGVAVDRIGLDYSLAAGLLIFGLAQIGRSFATGFPSLLACTLLIGVGATVITFGLPKLVSILFPPAETGFPSSIYLVGAAAGTASAFAIGRPVIGPFLGGWRPLFLWSGVFAVGYAVVWFTTARVFSLEGTTPEHERSEDATLASNSISRDIRAILAHRELRLVVVVGTVYLLVIHGMQGWLPTILESRGMDPGPAGQATSLLIGANVVGILVVPTVADRLEARRAAVMTCGCVIFVGLAGVLAGGIGLLMAAGVVATGFGVGGLSPLIRAIPPELEGIGARLTGTAVGFVFAVGEIGGFLGPVLIGTLHDLTGSFAPGLLVLAGGAVVAVGAGYAMQDVSG